MKTIENDVRGVRMKFVGYTRSLELCSRMNYETENLDFIDQIRPGETLFDLGACEGRFSIYAALKGVNCYSFEPESRNYQAFRENIKLNCITDEVLHSFKMAVGEMKRSAKLKIGQAWAGGHQKVIEQADGRIDLNFNFVEEEEVQVVSIDSFISEYKTPFPKFIKIDVDGSELSFIEGAKNTLADRRLKKIIFELNEQDKNYSKIVDSLMSMGLKEEARFQVPNEPLLYNIIYDRVDR